MLKTILLICVLGSISLYTTPSHADEFQPLAVRISFTTGNADKGYVYQLETSIPNDQRLRELPSVELQQDCSLINQSLTQQANKSWRQLQSYQCQTSLHGSSISIRYLQGNPGLSSIVTVDLGDGHAASTALAAHQETWQIPAKPSTGEVAKQYLELGVVHLLTGFDHLLFIACLLFICFGNNRQLIWTITAFTLAHSLSLGLTAFGKITVNVGAVEAVIALSIAYLASDIARHVIANKDAHNASLSYRYPASIAAGFGLLHGLGFANILNEFGLPQSDKLVALFSFNLGIELGQLLFVFSLLALSYLAKRSFAALNQGSVAQKISLTASYFIGCVTLYWTVERVASSL